MVIGCRITVTLIIRNLPVRQRFIEDGFQYTEILVVYTLKQVQSDKVRKVKKFFLRCLLFYGIVNPIDVLDKSCQLVRQSAQLDPLGILLQNV